MQVRLATPCLSSQVGIEFLMSALATSKLLLEEGVAHTWANRPGDPFIAKCRSNMVCDFLDSTDTDLFFLDDDIGWPPEKVLEFIRRDEPILAGVYPQKLDTLNWPCSLEADGDELVEKDGLYKAVGAPTGFMRIKRWVLEEMYKVSAPYRETDHDGITRERRAIFNAGPAADGNWWGEDFAFCNMANNMGIDIWIDPDIPFYHRGGKRFEGRMSQSIDTFKARAKSMATTSEAA